MIVTNVGGLAEIVPDGVSGYVVEPDPVAIAGAICDFFSGDEKRFEAGIEKKKKEYSWSRLTEALHSLVREVQRAR
jgi:glycosyltransferase involved in cell wall biosynthesis